MTLLPLSATVNILEMINICVQSVLNTVKLQVTNIHGFTLGNYKPDTLSCVGSHACCVLCRMVIAGHVIYFKPMVLPFLSPALIISVAKLRGRS